MQLPRAYAAAFFLAGFATLPLSAAPAAKTGATAEAIDPSLLRGMEWRSIGPYRGGRSVAVAGVRDQPSVFYFGGTGGGVWKTTDGGINWLPVTDGQLGTGSVGAIAVADSDPNVVYVGMGEGCIRGNLSHGDGVYKSTDAGKTWKRVGLADTRQIGRVRVHPKDPNLVYVAALGHAFGPSKERGVFRSRDGGATWQNVLFVDDKTGAIDLALDPTNPRVMYAAFWQAVRTPYSLESGGPGSALYRSTDGGDTWSKVTGEGLPKKGVWGRIGVAISPANPNRVWALIEAEDGGVYRSDDAGRTWKKLNDERRLRQRAWYYTHIFADPKNADSVFVLNTSLYRSLDGGKTYTRLPAPHGDHHDLWIAPEDPHRMINANDGGANVSFDGGQTWSRQDNQPTAQFYHAVTDDRFPYFVYGAQQDNTTVAIVSRTPDTGIDATEWYTVGGCESGFVAPNPKDPEVVYAGCYDGYISRFDHRTRQTRNISVYPDNPMGWGAEGMKYRFQWTFPIVVSPHDAGVLYAAGNVVFRSTNEGQSWEKISPDLTRNDPTKLGPSGGPITKDNTSVEYYCTVFALAESRLERGLLWAGSDDGLVHVSRDGGQNWTNVTAKGIPEWSLVSQIDPSPHEAGTAFLAISRYRNDDLHPYAYVTTDYGKSWRSIAAGLPDDGVVRVVREDPKRKGLLYAGTEKGVYVSFDSGARWQPLQMDVPAPAAPRAEGGKAAIVKIEEGKEAEKPKGLLPVVPITDLVVKDDDLVVSTQGRSFWILDDLSPLRQAKAEIAASEAHLFTPRPAMRFFGGAGSVPGQGQNPPSGAVIYYYLKAAPKEGEEVTLEFLDSSSNVMRKISSKTEAGGAEEPADEGEEFGPRRSPRTIPAKAGLNRFAWDLRYPEASRFKGMILWAGGVQGPVVVPGKYQVRLTAGGKSLTEPFDVVKDPRLSATDGDYQKQSELLKKIHDKLTETHDAIARIRSVREQVKTVFERVKAAGGNQAIVLAAESLDKNLTAVEEELYQTKNQSSQDPLNYPIRLNNKLSVLAGVVGSADGPPTEQSYAVYDDLVGRIDAQLERLRSIVATDLAAFNALVKQTDVPAVVVKTK
jgi:photosystem II stability/assembly factor-like uncharacterized protein